MSIQVPREDLGEALHTGLRKGCDSEWANLMHSIIYILDENYWDDFLDVLHDNFERNGVTAETLLDVFHKFDNGVVYQMHEQRGTLNDYIDYKRSSDRDMNYVQTISAFDSASSLMGEGDAASLHGWFTYCFMPIG